MLPFCTVSPSHPTWCYPCSLMTHYVLSLWLSGQSSEVDVIFIHGLVSEQNKRGWGVREWWNGEEKIITEDPVRQSDSLLLEIFMKICPWKLLVFGSQSFPHDFLRNILRKIPQWGDNKMHFVKWFFFFFWVWHGVSLSHIFTVDCNSSSSKANLTASALVTLCLLSRTSPSKLDP